MSPDVPLKAGSDLDRQALAIEVLKILNRCSSGRECIRELLSAIQEATGFEAVAIRLQEGQDFPYFMSSGFPAQFLEAENSLCEYNACGSPKCGQEGAALLSCMCGLILRGNTLPELPFFTPGGSFWTNSSSQLLESRALESLNTSLRRRCPEEGYESIALIPIVSGSKRIGLLQLNDKRSDCLRLDTVLFFEELGQSIGIAFDRICKERALQEANADLERRVREKTAALESALKEKEALLQEVHHRVKNNLQVVDGLLGLTMNRARQEETLDVCRNIRSQVLGMSLVHHQLYSNARLHEIRFDVYLQRLWQELSRVFPASHIQAHFQLQEITLPLQLAHPCSLAMNEALSNVLKHAFPNEQAGRVWIRMRTEKNLLQLTVADDGIGVPDNIDELANHSLGLKLLKSIVQGQLQGRLEIFHSEGTTVRLHIPYPQDREDHAP